MGDERVPSSAGVREPHVLVGSAGEPGDERPEAPAAEPAPRESPSRLLVPGLVVAALLLVAVVVGSLVVRTPPAPVRTVDAGPAVAMAASRAAYPLPVPTGLPAGYRTTAVSTNADSTPVGGPVTLSLTYATPSGGRATFVVSDNPGAPELLSVFQGIFPLGPVGINDHNWTRSHTVGGQTAYSRPFGGTVTVVVYGAALDDELMQVAAAVQPRTG